MSAVWRLDGVLHLPLLLLQQCDAGSNAFKHRSVVESVNFLMQQTLLPYQVDG